MGGAGAAPSPRPTGDAAVAPFGPVAAVGGGMREERRHEVTTGEAAAALGVSRQRVSQLVRKGKLRARRVGAMWLVEAKSVAERRKGRP